MSMNHYMHPRNIYRTPPNFKQLALDYPEFRKFVSQDITGKVTFDFKNTEALRALTCTLLKKDFDIDLEIPVDKLIPTVPLRVNYILWIEDLLNLITPGENVKGIDIGTGASCIYPLIIAKKNKWFMLATEIDHESINYAFGNISRNKLENFIQLVRVNGETLLEEALKLYPDSYDFCMCNPPFFATPQELQFSFKARKLDRPRPKNAFCASAEEVVVTGGEVDYITKLIHESKNNPFVKIFTTMVGHKTSLPPLKVHLRQINVVSFKTTEFCQGNTTRWGLAWTFQDIDLRQIPNTLIDSKKNLPKPLLLQIANTNDSFYKIKVVSDKLTKIFNDLQMEYQEVKHVKDMIEFIIVAYADTWSGQRRKRREKLRNKVETSEIKKTCEKLAEMDFSFKRSFEDDSGFYSPKRVKTDDCMAGKVYLKAKVGVIRVEQVIGLELVYIEGSGTKEALHQVYQFIKNNITK